MLVQLQYPRIPGHVLENLFVTESNARTKKFPAMDIVEYDNELVVTAELPGVKKDQVKVTFENGILAVEGQRKPNEPPKDAQVLLNEMRAQDFSRSIRINVEVDASNITAELEDGILRVVLPKAPESKVRTVQVK